MLEKLIKKFVVGTKYYLALEDRVNKLETDIDTFEEEIERLNVLIATNKTKARKIIRIVKGLIKREDSISTTKEIKALCNEIIKGE